MEIVFIFVAVLIGFIIFWIVLSKSKPEQESDKSVTYECSHCGESHCDCYREDEAKKSSDSRSDAL